MRTRIALLLVASLFVVACGGGTEDEAAAVGIDETSTVVPITTTAPASEPQVADPTDEPTETSTPMPTPAGTVTSETAEPTTLFVGSELMDCVGEVRQTCMQVRQDPTAEYELFYDLIDGFDFEPGFIYELQVLITQMDDPPADGSSLAYELVEVVSKEASDTVLVTGEITYRERIALRPGSTATITLWDVSQADSRTTTVATETIDLTGQSVPVPFELEVAADDFVEDNRYRLWVTINAADGSLRWTTDTPYVVDPTDPTNELGELVLVQVATGGDGGVALPMTAQGNEPGWSVTITKDQIDLVWNFGEQSVVTPRPDPVVVDGSVIYEAATSARSVRVAIRNALCRDDATGMPHPFTVTVTVDGRALSGCGGEPMSLLTANGWVVHTIAGLATVANSQPTLVFGADGSLSGDAPCNSFSTNYEVTGEALTIGKPIAVSTGSCVQSLGNQEASFLGVLESVARFDFSGADLIIISTDGTEIVASPTTAP